MIEGLHFDITTSQLKTVLETKIAHHKGRAQHYSKQLEAFGTASTPTPETNDDVKTVNYSSRTNDPTEGIRDNIVHHKNKVRTFEFMAAHLIPNETYRLATEDLNLLGISTRF